MKTILLDTVTWDLLKDANGNIALANDPYAVSQDVSSAIKLFSGELWYDTTKGIPYWTKILGKLPPLALIKSYYVSAAKTVPGVVSAKCFISAVQNRNVSGQVVSTTRTESSISTVF